MATEHIREALQKDRPEFVIPADIKSFYSSIPHHKLVADIRSTFDDPKVQRILEEIITNIIDTPRGLKIQERVLHCVGLFRSCSVLSISSRRIRHLMEWM